MLFIMLHIFMLCFTVAGLAQFMQHTAVVSINIYMQGCFFLCFQWSRVMKANAVLHCAPELMLLTLSHLINNY